MKQKNRAIDCKWVRNSSSSPDYHKYMITYLNTKGKEVVVPAYGKDMQEALKRVNNSLNKEKRASRLGVIMVFSIITFITVAALLISELL